MRNPESVRKSQKNSQVKGHGENERNRARHTSQKKSPMNVREAQRRSSSGRREWHRVRPLPAKPTGSMEVKKPENGRGDGTPAPLPRWSGSVGTHSGRALYGDTWPWWPGWLTPGIDLESVPSSLSIIKEASIDCSGAESTLFFNFTGLSLPSRSGGGWAARQSSIAAWGLRGEKSDSAGLVPSCLWLDPRPQMSPTWFKIKPIKRGWNIQ